MNYSSEARVNISVHIIYVESIYKNEMIDEELIDTDRALILKKITYIPPMKTHIPDTKTGPPFSPLSVTRMLPIQA